MTLRYDVFWIGFPYPSIGWQVYSMDGRLIAQSALVDAYEYSNRGEERADEDARNLTERLKAQAAPAGRPEPVLEAA